MLEMSRRIESDDSTFPGFTMFAAESNHSAHTLKLQNVEYRRMPRLTKSTVIVKLTNAAPAKGPPDYVAVSPSVAPDFPIQVPAGTNITSVALLATNKKRETGERDRQW